MFLNKSNNEDESRQLFSWPVGCNVPEWAASPDNPDQPGSLWWLEVTDASNPSNRRIVLDRFMN